MLEGTAFRQREQPVLEQEGRGRAWKGKERSGAGEGAQRGF